MKEGCDRQTLESLFILLVHKKPVQLEVDAEHGRRREVQVNLNTLDSQDILNGMSPRQVDQIAARAGNLAADVLRLRRTPLVRHLAAEGRFEPGDLLCGSEVFLLRSVSKSIPPALQGIVRLPELARELGIRQRPEYVRRLKKIYVHIHECSGKWHDAEVAEILLALDPESPVSGKDLQAWRKRQGLTG